jgi:hypothetical protein
MDLDVDYGTAICGDQGEAHFPLKNVLTSVLTRVTAPRNSPYDIVMANVYGAKESIGSCWLSLKGALWAF